jgi:fatty acid desaturase
MHPTVPFHSLARLHREIESESPPPYPNTLVAWNEMIRALWRQRREPSFSVHRSLPSPTPGRPLAADDGEPGVARGGEQILADRGLDPV